MYSFGHSFVFISSINSHAVEDVEKETSWAHFLEVYLKSSNLREVP
jgi:hypothetical protein